jgi:RNA polymerase sigma-70 factor (ECF subfamily)
MAANNFMFEEASWIDEALRGDLEAFNHLVLLNQDMAYNHALALLNNPDLAEDVTQESFLKAFQALRSLRQGSFRGWLLRIVTNTAYDLVRKFHRHPLQPLFAENEGGEELDTAPWMVDAKASVQEAVGRNEVSRDLRKLLDEIPAVYRTVLILSDVYELDYAEVARALHIPLGTVKSRLARARFKMREK